MGGRKRTALEILESEILVCRLWVQASLNGAEIASRTGIRRSDVYQIIKSCGLEDYKRIYQ